jgi:hypothetical protein
MKIFFVLMKQPWRESVERCCVILNVHTSVVYDTMIHELGMYTIMRQLSTHSTYYELGSEDSFPKKKKTIYDNSQALSKPFKTNS